MPNIITHKRSSTSGVVPAASGLSQGELAINIADGKFYTKNNANSVINLGVTSISGTYITPASGLFTSNLIVNGNVGIGTSSPVSKLQVSGLVTANSGNFTNSLQVNGTGVVSSSGGNSGYLSKFAGSNTINNSLVYDDGTNIGIGTVSPIAKLEVAGDIYGNNVLSTGYLISNFLLSVNDFDGGSPGIINIGEFTSLNQLYWSIDQNGSGNFSVLSVNDTNVSLNGHTHTASNITNFNSSVSGLLPVGTANYLSKFGTGGSGLGNSLIFDNGTNIGIGTNSPTNVLSVIGTEGVFSVSGSDLTYGGQSPTINLKGYTWFGKADGSVGIGAHHNDATTFGSSADFYMFEGANETVTQYTPICFAASYNPQLYLNTDGNVGMGTSSPGSPLTIATAGAAGTIGGASQTQIFQVNDASASDYVNLGHFNCESSASRGSFMLSNNGTVGAWQDNCLQFFNHGSSYPYGYYGGNLSDAGCAMIVTQGSDIQKLQIGNYDNVPIEFFTNNVKKFGITANGNLEIFTSVDTDFSPGSYLIWNNTYNNTGQLAAIGVVTGATSSDGRLAFYTGAANSVSEKVIIDEDGNVGIGTSGPSEALEVVGNIKTNSNLKINTTSLSESQLINIINGGNLYLWSNFR